MSDPRDEWFKLVLEELRKNNDKLDDLRDKTTIIKTTFKMHEDKDNDRFGELSDSMKALRFSVHEQNTNIKKYNELLKEHMRRTELLEESHGKVWERVKPVVRKHENNAIIKMYFSDQTKKNMKILAIVTTIAGTITAVLKLMGMF